MEITERQFYEALDLIQEECAEVIQAISKIRRFGPDSTNPYLNDGKNNVQYLTDELGDLQLLIDYLTESGSISVLDILKRIEYKKSKLRNYTRLYESNNLH